MKNILIRTLILLIYIISIIITFVYVPIVSSIVVLISPIIGLIYIFTGKKVFDDFGFNLFDRYYDFSDTMCLSMVLSIDLVIKLENHLTYK